MTTGNRDRFTAGLRAVAAFLDDHPEVPLPYLGSPPELMIYLHGDGQRARLAAITRAMGNVTKTPVSYSDGAERFQVQREFDGIALVAQATRDQVCTRVVTGTEDREVEEVVTPAVTRKVTKPVEVVTWECLPILAATGAGVTEAAIEGDPDAVADALAQGVLGEPTAERAAAGPGLVTPPACTECHATGTRLNNDGVCVEPGPCADRQAAKASTR